MLRLKIYHDQIVFCIPSVTHTKSLTWIRLPAQEKRKFEDHKKQKIPIDDYRNRPLMRIVEKQYL